MGTGLQINSHRDLIVWQKGMHFSGSCLQSDGWFPKEETYTLTNQIRRAVVRVPADIAESQRRRLAKEYLYFLANARGSLLELDTHLEIAGRLGYFSKGTHVQLVSQVHEVAKLLNGLMRSVEQSSNI